MSPSFFSKQHKIPGRFVLLVLASVLAISSCASFRHYDLLGSATSLATTKSFYVVVNGATEKVDYDYLGEEKKCQEPILVKSPPVSELFASVAPQHTTDFGLASPLLRGG
jgi:hypothetical protein